MSAFSLDVLPGDDPKTSAIPRILETNYVMRIAHHGLCIRALWKQILTQIQYGDVAMVGMFCQ